MLTWIIYILDNRSVNMHEYNYLFIVSDIMASGTSSLESNGSNGLWISNINSMNKNICFIFRLFSVLPDNNYGSGDLM